MIHHAPTLDDLNSLNLEIAALVKAGVPLELGLRGLANVQGSKLSAVADRIATRLATGQSLPEAMSVEGSAISSVYTAVMKAGLACGKLPEALESVASSGQLIQKTRRRIWLATIYPAICLIVAYLIFCFFVVNLAPRLFIAAELIPQSWPIRMLRALNQYQIVFTTVIPGFLLVLSILVVWLRTGVTQGFWDYLTSFRWIIGRNLNWSQFAELLALQLEQDVRLPEAFVQAADATDDLRWKEQSREVANRLTQGKSFVDALQSATRLPPVIRWMLASAEKEGQLTTTLRRIADIYRRRAVRQAAIVKIWLPVTMTLVFTIGLGLTYGLAFFIPLRSFLFELTRE